MTGTPPAPPPAPALVVCADLGSTYTKVCAVDVVAGAIAATASHRTTVDSDVLGGLDAALDVLAQRLPGADLAAVRACSSAGGGLRLAVVGYEPLVSARAGQMVALTAGARVVHVAAGRLGDDDLAALAGVAPDIVLLVGGTDGGDAEVLLHNADRLAAGRSAAGRSAAGHSAGGGPPVPVVVAGNIDARDGAVAALGARAVGVDNVLPRIGLLRPEPARAAIRDAFLRHVIGGDRLSSGPRLRSLVRAATPDTVLTAVQVLAAQTGQDLLVVDVGGATTDVYSAVGVADVYSPVGVADAAVAGAASAGAAVAGTLRCARTVEGDLGVRAGAVSLVAAARIEGLVTTEEADTLAAVAERLAMAAPAAGGVDLRLAELAVVIALRRHARDGRDLRGVRLVVGSGGVLRHATREAAHGLLARAVSDVAGGWALPRDPAIVVDRRYALAPAGLLAADYRPAASAILRRLLDDP